MSKRKVQFDENVKEEKSIEPGDGEPERKTRFKENHSLDSDEEDTSEKYKVMDDEDIEGQEATTIEVDDGITITPFNMREELEEGHFDSDGTYIFKKDAEVHDNWLDSVDWKPLKGQEFQEKGDSNDSEPDDVDVRATYKQVLEVLRPGETVTGALQRLGGSRTLSASERCRRRKAAKKAGQQQQQEEGENAKHNRTLFLRLTELASALLQAGRDEVYQETYEKIKHTVEQQSEATGGGRDAQDSDDALDMFAHGIDTDTQSKLLPESASSAAAATASTSSEVASGEVEWEYKWEDKDEIEVYGPYTSPQMADWQADGFFKSGVFVRKVGVTDGRFYNSRRIDFELYI